MVDIASEAKVSRMAVSSVLFGTGEGRIGVSTKKAREIRAIAERLKYRPNLAARQLRGKRSYTFGLLVASAGDPLRSFLVQYLDEEAARHDCNSLIGNTVVAPGRFEQCVSEFSARGVDGVFCAVHNWCEGDRLKLLERVPNTIFYENPGVPAASYVTVDRAEASRLAVNHLLERGRRRIGIGALTPGRPTHQARLSGYREALSARSIQYRPDYVYQVPPEELAFARHNEHTRAWDLPADAVDKMIDHLVVKHRVDAIVAYDDFWASMIIKRLKLRGIKVPGDVAIVGYLNHYLCDWTDPALTTIDLSHRAAAASMVELLQEMVLEKADAAARKPKVITVKPTLVIRESA